jgi:hypothetical protein
MNKQLKFDKDIFFISYFIIKEDREKIEENKLKGTRTDKILKTKNGIEDFHYEIADWVAGVLENKPLIIIPFPSTNRYKSKKRQLPFLLIKELCKKNKKWIDGSNLLFRKFSIPKNTRDVFVQIESLELLDVEKIINQEIVLLDDVVTTGSSLKAGINIIKRGIPKSVRGLAVARKVYLKDVGTNEIF